MLDTISLPDTDWDWSEESGSLEYLRQRRRQCMAEAAMFSILQSVFHLAMLAPLLYTGTITMSIILASLKNIKQYDH